MYQFLVRLSCWQKWRLFFCQKYFTKKRQVFFNLEVNTGKKKESNRFGLLFREAFCFGKWYEEKHMEKQKSKTTNIETLPKKWLRQTHVPYFNKKILKDGESFFATSNNGYKLRRKLRDTCLDILGLRLELEKAVKCLYNTNIWNLLWAPPFQGKICLCYSDVLHRNFGELKQSKKAMKHEGHCTGLLRPTPFHFKLWGTTLHFCFPSSPIIRSLRLRKRFFVLQNFLVEIWHVRLS